MRKMRIAICDKSPKFIQIYENLCKKVCQSRKIPAEIRSFQTSQSLIFEMGDSVFCEELDIIFYSIDDKKDMDAVDVMRKNRYTGLIVLLNETGENISIERIFDGKVFNFVKKTAEKENIARFAQVLQMAANIATKAHSKKISLTYGGEMRVINLADVICLERQGRGIEISYGQGEKFYFLSTIVKMEEQLKGKDIVKASGSFLIHLGAIAKLTRTEAIMRGSMKIPISRSCYPTIRNELVKRGADFN